MASGEGKQSHGPSPREESDEDCGIVEEGSGHAAVQGRLSRKEINNFWKQFELYDRQGTGRISTEDLTALLRLSGYSPESIVGEAHYRRGTISFDEFISLMKRFHKALLLHCGGTLGMDPAGSFDEEGQGGLKPGKYLKDVVEVIPELRTFANIDMEVVFNKDSAGVGPSEWQRLAETLHKNREQYDMYIIAHGTDTMAFTASAISLMLKGFNKPVIFTGSQVPLAMPRNDARSNLIDSLATATTGAIKEVCICFGGKVFRGNRARKIHSTGYNAFDSPTMNPLASLGVSVRWHRSRLLHHAVEYTPRFSLDTRVIRVAFVPGVDPFMAFGSVASRGIKGVVVECVGTGNLPPPEDGNWLQWIHEMRQSGVRVVIQTQSSSGEISLDCYATGKQMLKEGVEVAQLMTPECAVVKLMLSLVYPAEFPIDQPVAGECEPSSEEAFACYQGV